MSRTSWTTALVLIWVAGLATAQAPLRVHGEVYARSTAVLMPPAVDRLSQFTVTQLAPDGAQVREGDVVLAFDSNEIIRQLGEKQSQREAKRRELKKLDLDLAERSRSEGLSTALAAAELHKAQRKTEQPQELVAALQYAKFVAERKRAEHRAKLAVQRERLLSVQRTQERRVTTAELAQLETDVTRLGTALAAMNVTAPRSGVMMHKSSWNNEKFDVGSQVWRGQTVAQIPDTTTLAVRAALPERELARVSEGAPARIIVEGGGGSVHRGTVTAIGRAVHSKSQVQPIPVLDLEITLDAPATHLRPGQSVRVELSNPDGAS
ncbi:HlyD family secretion protein [Xanthomonas sp. 3075]|uniref:HlyD family secretion protein n=1 Tax=Xanthomonas sp. 3075 TaxID=3035315 RepID=UPI00160D4314|nr:HlyD family secretion protein [Xanthomonas sp. 3075]MBB4131818.1 multidrug resistance efflux pump [Xanthomonas sp. 3075]